MEQSIDLGNILKSLGMSDLFDQAKADLSGISGVNELFVSKVVHKAFIEVREKQADSTVNMGSRYQLKI